MSLREVKRRSNLYCHPSERWDPEKNWIPGQARNDIFLRGELEGGKNIFNCSIDICRVTSFTMNYINFIIFNRKYLQQNYKLDKNDYSESLLIQMFSLGFSLII